MKRSAKEHRQEFEELGYTVFEGVLTQGEIDYALPIFDENITIDTKPPVVTGDQSARRQINTALYCEPRLSAFGGRPVVLETVAVLMDRSFRLFRSPGFTVTFPGKAGGVPGQNWRGHVDWHKPRLEGDELFIYGIVHFTTVEPNGGVFTVVPGSHHVVRRNFSDPAMAERMLNQQFQGFPDLNPEKEIRGQAGDILYYHPLMVHGASDNQSRRARKIVSTHYFPILEGEAERKARANFPGNFHPDHLAVMDEDFKKLITSGWFKTG